MFERHFIAANFVRQAMQEALEGSGPERSGRDTQEILLAAEAPRRTGWLEAVLRRWASRRPATQTQAGC